MKLAVAVLSALVLVGCASDDTRDAGSAASATAAPSTEPTTEPTSTTLAPTTTSSTTTTTLVPTTTSSTTTTAAPTTPAPASEWRAIDPSTVALPLAQPCCGSDWEGVPSPELPGPGAPLPDGLYAVDGLWPANPSDPIPLRVMRFVECGLIEANCGANEPYPPSAMGVDRGQFRTVAVPLDAKLTVIYSGFEVDASGQWLAATSTGDGTNLAQLATALDAAYERRVGSRVRAGEDAHAVLADVAANPGDGFSAAPEGAGLVMFDDGNAPPVLFQTAFDRGADALGMVVLDVRGGNFTLVVYGGFYS